MGEIAHVGLNLAIQKAIRTTRPSLKRPETVSTGRPVIQLKFTYGKKQTVDEIELDNLFTDLQGVLKKHPLVPAANIDTLVSEWINDLLFLAGKITEEELKEAMQAFETKGAEATVEVDDENEDSDDEDDEE